MPKEAQQHKENDENNEIAQDDDADQDDKSTEESLTDSYEDHRLHDDYGEH